MNIHFTTFVETGNEVVNVFSAAQLILSIQFVNTVTDLIAPRLNCGEPI